MKRCKHCGAPIRETQYLTGKSWVHYIIGASGSDGDYTYCKLTTATPEDV